MKFIYRIFLCLFLSLFFTFLILIFFKPILTASNLIFPYAVHPFDIAKDYQDTWFYIKLIYCSNIFVTNFVIVNSIFTYFISIKKPKNKRNVKKISEDNKNNFNLLIGLNSQNKEKVFIPEKGL